MPPEDPLHLPRRLFVELELRGMLLLLARLGALAQQLTNLTLAVTLLALVLKR